MLLEQGHCGLLLCGQELERDRQAGEVDAQRRSAIGSGERAEKIRTYNYPQDRITDHRIGLDVHGMPAVLDGELDKLIDALVTADQAERLASMERSPDRAE